MVELALSNNNLTELDLSNNNSIQLLSIENNAIATLDLSGMTNLMQLKIGGNGLTACQLNDIYYSLPQYPELSQEEQDAIAGYPLNVGQAGEATPNDSYGADASIATSKGWSINIAGNGNGCETAYIDIIPSENGSIRLYDVDNNEILSGTTTLRNSDITVVATPAEGYAYTSVLLNDVEEVKGNTFMIGAYCRVQGLFNSNQAIDDNLSRTTRVFATRGAIHVVAHERVMVAVYTIDGRLVYETAVLDNVSIPTPSGMYIVRVVDNNQTETHTIAVQ